MAIVMRLHGLIMAAAAGCRCFALSYDPKVRQVATTLDLSFCELGNLPEDATYLVETWENLTCAQGLSREQRLEFSRGRKAASADACNWSQ